MNETLCRMSELRAPLEYIPLRSDPARGVSLPGVPSEGVRMADPEEGPGPLMSFVLSLGQYFTAGALFAAVALMLMVAGAGM